MARLFLLVSCADLTVSDAAPDSGIRRRFIEFKPVEVVEVILAWYYVEYGASGIASEAIYVSQNGNGLSTSSSRYHMMDPCRRRGSSSLLGRFGSLWQSHRREIFRWVTLGVRFRTSKSEGPPASASFGIGARISTLRS